MKSHVMNGKNAFHLLITATLSVSAFYKYFPFFPVAGQSDWGKAMLSDSPNKGSSLKPWRGCHITGIAELIRSEAHVVEDTPGTPLIYEPNIPV